MTSAQVPNAQKVISQQLLDHIQQQIERNHGWMGFDEYMKLALYAPGLGYYAAGSQKFGAAGDFITAPEMGSLFGQCLAEQAHEILKHVGRGRVLEFGAGSGALAVTLLNALDALNCLPEEYLILEISSELRDRQLKTIMEKAQKHVSRVRWIDALPTAFEGVIIANEVLDAMPVKLFEQDQSGSVFERGVCVSTQADSEQAFGWKNRKADQTLQTAVDALGLSVETGCYQSEMHFQAQAWIRSLYDCMNSGVVLLIDYGFAQGEYYHPDRAAGTLMCHYRHHAHGDPFFVPGLQDITTHIDFSAIAQVAKVRGFTVAGYAAQGAFLLSLGLLDKVDMDASMQQQMEQAQQIKKLSMPHEMGELFKVLALSKKYDGALQGFAQQNNYYRL